MPRKKGAKRISWDVPVSLVSYVEYYAAQDDRSPAQWLRELVEREVQERSS